MPITLDTNMPAINATMVMIRIDFSRRCDSTNILFDLRSCSAIEACTLLTNIMVYWATGAIGSSFWPYYARIHEGWPLPDGAYVSAPTAYLAFPREIYRPPRSLAEQTFNIQRWTSTSRGGHFAALEQPDTLAKDLRAFFRPHRTPST